MAGLLVAELVEASRPPTVPSTRLSASGLRDRLKETVTDLRYPIGPFTPEASYEPVDRSAAIEAIAELPSRLRASVDRLYIFDTCSATMAFDVHYAVTDPPPFSLVFDVVTVTLDVHSSGSMPCDRVGSVRLIGPGGVLPRDP